LVSSNVFLDRFILGTGIATVVEPDADLGRLEPFVSLR